MKIWICAVAKMEELYIREWLTWHKSIGVDHIVLGDNNDSDYSIKLMPIVQDFIDDGFLKVIDKNDVLNVQQPFYREIYNQYKGEFDWIGFIDIDEFIHLPKYNNNIHCFFADKRLRNYNAVIMNWMNIGDSGHVYYYDKPVQERFTNPFFQKQSGIKYFVRPIEGMRITSIHNPFYGQNINIVNACDALYDKINGKEINRTTLLVKKEYYQSCYIRHYITKSTEEFIKYRIFRGRCDRQVGNHKIRYNKDYYFGINKYTKEKHDMFRTYFKKIQEVQNEEKNKYSL